jgi:uncharacterized protein (TIGR00369 family)
VADREPGFDSVPVNRMLGFTLRAHSPAGATVAFTPTPAMAQEYGVLHGGLVTALADTACVYALHPFLAADERMTSIELKVNFLAGARPERGEIVATSTVVRRGRTIAVVSADVRQGETHVATGLFTYMVMRLEPKETPR